MHRLAELGLTEDEAERRLAAGMGNGSSSGTSRPIATIIRANVFTRFNALLGGLLVVILVVGPLQDALFGVVLIANMAIGIVQELRAKRTLDRLTVLGAPRATVVRSGVERDVPTEEVVLGDVVVLARGDQVVADGPVLTSDGLELDESLLSGEAVPQVKGPGSEVRSGSFVVAGSGHQRADRVGADAFANRLATEARQFSLVRSELRAGIDKILRLVTWLLLPTALLVVSSQLSSHRSIQDAVRASVASVVSMVPEGLVLLTSLAFAVGVVRLGKRGVLTQELAALEGLARVDVLCIDKTGTLTEPTLELSAVEPFGSWTEAKARAALGALAAADPDPNASMRALSAACPSPDWTPTWRAPFSSARRSSATAFGDEGTWVLGAADALASTSPASAPASVTVAATVDRHARAGRRVLVLARSHETPEAGDPAMLEPVAAVAIEERMRADASTTLAFFAAQGVQLKVLSGDDPRTVAAVAARVGVPGADRAVEASTLPSDPDELATAMETTSVFGRVDPRQKQAMVAALQSRGHVVAMTGDGVNDVLALKQADLGVAMGSGSAATRAVAQLVLLDSTFDALPHVVAEGRRVIANVERVANLFLTKTVYATLLALSVGALRLPFPFLPRHLTVISALTIGIPGFFLALAPQQRRAESGFFRRVLRFALPAGAATAGATMAAYGLALRVASVSRTEARTAAAITLFIVALWVLGMLARPASPARGGLVMMMAAAFVVILAIPAWRSFFAFALPDPEILLAAIGVGALTAAGLEAGWRLSGVIRHHPTIHAGSSDLRPYQNVHERRDDGFRGSAEGADPRRR